MLSFREWWQRGYREGQRVIFEVEIFIKERGRLRAKSWARQRRGHGRVAAVQALLPVQLWWGEGVLVALSARDLDPSTHARSQNGAGTLDLLLACPMYLVYAGAIITFSASDRPFGCETHNAPSDSRGGGQGGELPFGDAS